jgi:hypothetical protein
MPAAIKGAAGCFGHGRFAGWLQVEEKLWRKRRGLMVAATPRGDCEVAISMLTGIDAASTATTR